MKGFEIFVHLTLVQGVDFSQSAINCEHGLGRD